MKISTLASGEEFMSLVELSKSHVVKLSN